MQSAFSNTINTDLLFFWVDTCEMIKYYRIIHAQEYESTHIKSTGPRKLVELTLGGPMIIPLQRVRVMSSSSSRPQLTVPSPTPFWPSSSSSSSRKLRGTFTPVKTHTITLTSAAEIMFKTDSAGETARWYRNSEFTYGWKCIFSFLSQPV